MAAIFDPIVIGGRTFKNRIMFPPLTTGYEARDGSISAQDIAFYSRLAEGGTGYIVLGDVSPIRSFTPTPKLYEDSQIPSFAALAAVVHAQQSLIGVQIFHPEYDCDAVNKLFAEQKFDEVRSKVKHDMEFFVDEVSEQVLMEIIEKMCACAVRAKAAGIDAIQIHGDRLAGALCSTKMNHRKDQFGGSLENRTRFSRLLVKAMKKAVPDLILEYKLSIVTPERGKGGIDLEDAPVFAKWLEEDGVDLLHVAQANHTGNMADTIPPMGVQPIAFFAGITAAIKQAVTIPVSVVGRIPDPSIAQKLLSDGCADIVALGRPLLTDPDWVIKAENNQADSIRHCIYCNKGCTDRIQNRSFLSCIFNAENGYEESRRIVPATVPLRVAVVGGGPAGLEAARVLSLKGHFVTLFEKENRLGGQLNLVCVPPRKEEMRQALYDLEYAAAAAGADLKTGINVTSKLLLSFKPDAVIAAVGATSFQPPIPGIDGIHVKDAWDILAGRCHVYGSVAVIGGGMVGCETAEYLAEKGCKVKIVEMLDRIAQGESTTILPTMMENYQKYGVEQYPSHKVAQILPNGLLCTDGDGNEVQIDCDFVVTAIGSKPCPFDEQPLLDAGIQIVKVGDCVQAGDLSEAIRTAYDAANAI